MDITQKNEFQLLIRYVDYCKATSQTAESNKPDWFDMDQQLALSIIYKNMTQTHLFPMDRHMFRHMKDQYKLMFIKALAWQIKYVNDNQDLYNNPTQYLASHTLGTSSTGPITQATLETLMNVLAPKAKFYLEQMGWLYKSLSDQYELSQFYDATIDDDYATESYVLEKMEDAMAYADLADQGVKTYIEEYWLQNQDGYGANKYFKVVEENNELKFKWVDLGGIVQDNLLQWDNETKEIFKGTEGAYTIVDDILLGDKTVLTRINEEVERAKAREDEIEAKIPSTETFATKEYVDTQDQSIKSYVDEQVAQAGKVQDVKVNGDSVVTDKVANIDLTPYAKVTDLETTNKNLTSEVTTRASQVAELTSSVNELNILKANAADVYTTSQTYNQEEINALVSQSSANFLGSFIGGETRPESFDYDAFIKAQTLTATPTNNDYVFVIWTSTVQYDRCKYNASANLWDYEYTVVGDLTSLSSRVTNIENVIPSDATTDNKLVPMSVLGEEVTARQQADEKEADARSAADDSLQATIDTVSSNLTTETTNRTNADDSLQATIDTVSSNLTTETTNRTNADASLQTQIDNIKIFVSTTYSELKSLRDSGGLTAGQWYRITDYVATTTQSNTQATTNQYDIIVFATSTSTLSEEARAIQHSGDTYFANSNLSAWKVWYCLDNDTNRFAWADSANGKGVVYHLIDEYQNSVWYDFKLIQVKNTNSSDRFYYLFDNSGVDASINSTSVYGNNFGFYVYGNKLNIGCNVLKGNTFRSNTIGNDFNSNTIGNYFYYNTIGNYFYSNTIGNDFKNNTIGNYFYSNTIGNDFYYNTIGNDFYYNTIGNTFKNNTIGNYFRSNTIGSGFAYNTIGNFFYYNTIGNYFYSNTIGNTFRSNTIGSGFYYNTIGSDFQNNTIGTSTTDIYYRYNYFGDGIQYVDITDYGTSSAYKSGISLPNGYAGTSTTHKTITSLRNNTTYYIGSDSSLKTLD